MILSDSIKKVLWAFAGFLLLGIPVAFGQVTSDLRQQISKAEEEIQQINRLIGSTRKEQGVTLDEMKLVGSKLENRQSIIKNINTEISSVSREVTTKNARLDSLHVQYANIKHRYSELIKISYKNYRNNSFLSFLLSAQDFSDVARRFYYVKRMGAELQKKGDELKKLESVIIREVSELNVQKTHLAGLHAQQISEVGKLESDRSELKKTEAELKKREKDLLAQAEAHRKRVVELERELQRLVTEDNKRNTNKTSAETVASTAGFEKRRGNLIRPVEGIIIDRYGVHDHPTQKGIRVNNKGINIATQSGSRVLAVYPGEVRKVFFFQGLGNSVMLRHGIYLTIYSNLSEVFVREGEQVIESQAIGAVAAPTGNQQASLHFEVWKESENLDPEKWIGK